MDKLKELLAQLETESCEYVGMWARESVPCNEPQKIPDDMLEFFRKCNAINWSGKKLENDDG